MKCLKYLCGLAAAATVALASAATAEPTVVPAVYSGDENPSEAALTAYRALSDSQSRNYDRTQDISPRQLLILLEVSERTGASLGQALATGEMESAHTWNDHVRPTLKNGNLGSATGVWQFLPATFHNIVKKFGTQLLAASEADAALGRDHLDLGDGPFSNAQVRGLIQETVDGKRGAEDEELQLLRHNFAVLAFAKHYLSLDSGATTPEEDYLYHFLGAGQGRRVLALARGEARDTLCVKPVEVAVPPLETKPELTAGVTAGEGTTPAATAMMKAATALQPVPAVIAQPAVVSRVAPAARPPAVVSRVAPAARPPVAAALSMAAALSRAAPVPGDARMTRDLAGSTLMAEALEWRKTRPGLAAGDGLTATMGADTALRAMRLGAVEPALLSLVAPAPPPVSSQWGLPANSPTVTGNLGMFYRDGKGQNRPYTWAGFMENLARRIRAKDQPALVRTKYGVGFGLTGGDMPQWAFNQQTMSEAAEFRHENGRTLLLPEALVTGPLGRDETRQYKQRLAALVSQGEDKPLETLPPEALTALSHLKMLPPNLPEAGTTNAQVRKALHNFRKKIGKDEPDDPAHLDLLTPAERIALEIYDQRLTHYDQLQAGQQASFGTAPDLNRIRKMPAGLQRLAAPAIATVQTALAAQGLLTRPTQKSVWRDKKRKRHEEYKVLPFAGKGDQATVAALNSFQWRHGLRRTDGVLDAVTLNMLSLPPMGPDIVLPLSGPQCPFDGWTETAPLCEVLTDEQGAHDRVQIIRRASRPRPILY